MEADKFKPITCAACGCIYEYEKDDRIKIEMVKDFINGKPYVVYMSLECPI